MIAIAGNLLQPNGDPITGRFRVTLRNQPGHTAGNDLHGQSLLLTLAADGAYSFSLEPGTYDVDVGCIPRFGVIVPASGGPYSLGQILE